MSESYEKYYFTMRTEEIQQLSSELSTRKLKTSVANRVRVYRPNLSADTVYRAFKIKDFENSTPLIKLIIKTGNDVLTEDNIRISSAEMI